MENKDRAIVLRTVKFGDNKLIIDLLTRESGRVSVVWKVSTSRTSKVRKQFFQPLTLLEVDMVRSPRQAMSMLADARLFRPYVTLTTDAVTLCPCCVKNSASLRPSSVPAGAGIAVAGCHGGQHGEFPSDVYAAHVALPWLYARCEDIRGWCCLRLA